MARAKRTDRAEARRRYRAALATEAGVDLDDLESEPSDEPSLAGSRRAVDAPGRSRDATRSAPATTGKSSSAPFGRVGFLDAFRLAVRPANIREDVSALPQLLRSKAIWPVSLVIIAVGVVYMLFPGYSLVAIATSTLLQPPALIPPFVAGLLAPRAAWLAGAVVGIVAAVVTSLILLVAAGPPTSGTPIGSVVFFLVVSPLFGAGVGAFAGFYRRFLRLSAPSPSSSQARSRRAGNRGRGR